MIGITSTTMAYFFVFACEIEFSWSRAELLFISFIEQLYIYSVQFTMYVIQSASPLPHATYCLT